MSTDFVGPEQRSFVASQAQAWGNIRERWREVGKTAIRLTRVSLRTQPPQEPDPPNPRNLSALERLPEEVLIAIMQCLDHESLYRFSQTTGYFLRLSFDSVFELDPAWRTFRYTIDQYFHEREREAGLRSGPRRRVLDWEKWRARNPNPAPLISSSKPESSGEPDLVQRPPEPASATRDAGDEDEGETMLDFMAGRYRQENGYALETNGLEEDETSSS
ncbi:hypothetical protein O1611_g7884 [Lasiodiplodia mahajangana]|uniref:Uncharacterized protein n=1 Tax=Lasiodiplodia mahajangana TaxID=1108764 RepID=A0ACC2JEU4_9PEZI|nr:hypothetical protein O1611_g7884 [Lasiodiplodia mahajangana]